MSDYRQLKVAVQDLLEELRISPACLETMANGYSPDYPGANVNKNREWKNPYCKVQLSMVVAQKLIGAGIIHPEKTQTPAVKKIMSWYDVLPLKKQDMVVERLHELMVEFTTQVACVEELVHNVVNHHGVADTQRLLQEAVRGE